MTSTVSHSQVLRPGVQCLRPSLGARSTRARRAFTPVRSALETPPATETSAGEAPSTSAYSGPAPATLAFTKDTEDFQQLMGFAGSAPERANGRAAMAGFAFVAAAELSSHTSVLEQLQAHPIGTAFFATMLGIATVMPKFATFVSLKDLVEEANSNSLPAALKYFDKDIELWTGRVAMIGFLGLTVVEGFKGSALF